MVLWIFKIVTSYLSVTFSVFYKKLNIVILQALLDLERAPSHQLSKMSTVFATWLLVTCYELLLLLKPLLVSKQKRPWTTYVFAVCMHIIYRKTHISSYLLLTLCCSLGTTCFWWLSCGDYWCTEEAFMSKRFHSWWIP